MLVSPVPLSDSALVGLPVLHASTDPTRDALTAASLMTNLQVASAVVSSLHLRETPAQLLANVSATPIGQSNLVAVQATASSAGLAQQIANQFVQQVVVTRAASRSRRSETIRQGIHHRGTGGPDARCLLKFELTLPTNNYRAPAWR